MSDSAAPRAPGVQPRRLSPEAYRQGFCDLHAPLDLHAARAEADRCYFCHDAPCVAACPTSIDIPMFIRQISAGNATGAAKTIFDQNILGGMCARVCPTETLCEEACVREKAEGEPVIIGRLQRFATDSMMDKAHPYRRAPVTGKRVAVVGGGPAGLACAHRLAMKGHDAVILEARPKAGGLNEYGIAAYKATNDIAAREVAWLMEIGGITLQTGVALGKDATLDGLLADYDAVFLGMGLGGVNALGVSGDDLAENAVDFISDLRQADDLAALPIGRRVAVIGGGMTAIDAAVQAKLLGAEDVTILYRRGRDKMGASQYEQDLASQKGVRILCNLRPASVAREANGMLRLEAEEVADAGGALKPTGGRLSLPVDQIFRAIGQKLEGAPAALAVAGGKIWIDAQGRTSVKGVWAGGDCAAGGRDLTVEAVADGRDAAEDIHRFLSGEG